MQYVFTWTFRCIVAGKVRFETTETLNRKPKSLGPNHKDKDQGLLWILMAMAVAERRSSQLRSIMRGIRRHGVAGLETWGYRGLG